MFLGLVVAVSDDDEVPVISDPSSWEFFFGLRHQHLLTPTRHQLR